MSRGPPARSRLHEERPVTAPTAPAALRGPRPGPAWIGPGPAGLSPPPPPSRRRDGRIPPPASPAAAAAGTDPPAGQMTSSELAPTSSEHVAATSTRLRAGDAPADSRGTRMWSQPTAAAAVAACRDSRPEMSRTMGCHATREPPAPHTRQTAAMQSLHSTSFSLAAAAV